MKRIIAFLIAAGNLVCGRQPDPRHRRVTVPGVRRVTVLALFPALGLAAGGVAQAAVVVQCVPNIAGQPVVSGGAAGTCPAGTTKVSLPASASDQQTLNSILPHLSFSAAAVGGKPTIQVQSANLQILSGSGSTAGAVNGGGNLVIGYDESPGTQTGSHNLVLGTNQTFSSYGAILGGSHNSATGAGSTVLGLLNKASGSRATVTGGRDNTAQGHYSSVSGGEENTAKAAYSSVSGGRQNLSSAAHASATGGFSNSAATQYSTVLGGCSNAAARGVLAADNPFCDSIDGFQTISGGRRNTAEGTISSISGGYKNTIDGPVGAILGGLENYVDQVSTYSSISGGTLNVVSGTANSILGGSGRALVGGLAGRSQAGPTVFAP